jgi:hypothetical protein
MLSININDGSGQILSWDFERIIEVFFSINNFHNAWSKVQANKGSAGIDNETISDFAHNLSYN